MKSKNKICSSRFKTAFAAPFNREQKGSGLFVFHRLPSFLLSSYIVLCLFLSSCSQDGGGSNPYLDDFLPPDTVGSDPSDPSPAPGPVVSVDPAVSAGRLHSCALLANGTVKCWGSGALGQLGQDNTNTIGSGVPGNISAADALPINLGSGRTAKAISVGANHSCALLDDNTVKCWGEGASGRLGQDSQLDLGDDPGEMASLSSINLGIGRTAQAISAGDSHTCALLDDGTAKCWGRNSDGLLGQGHDSPVGDAPGDMAGTASIDLDSDLVSGQRPVAAISAGKTHTCILFLNDDTVKCLGNADNGQLGQNNRLHKGDHANETIPPLLPPIDLGSGRTAKAISAGEEHSCAILDDDTVKCWGLNDMGQLGQDNTTTIGNGTPPCSPPPPCMANPSVTATTSIDLGTGRTAQAISAGRKHTCVILDDDTAKCWGEGDNGQLGQENGNHLGDDSGEMGSLMSIDLGSGRTAKAISAGDSHTCALLDDDTVKCWGEGGAGQLGQGSTTDLGDNSNEMGDDLDPINL